MPAVAELAKNRPTPDALRPIRDDVGTRNVFSGKQI
jgi:hypothetical protein